MNDKRISKTECKRLTKELFHSRRPVWPQLTSQGREAAFSYAEEYKDFISQAKTEREAVAAIGDMATRHGFVHIGQATPKSRKLLWTFRDKVAAMAVVGTRPLSRGARIIASHIDAPRLDLKLNPLYEDLDMAFLKTHYYGGIKKFHWVARPLALHGLVLKGDGTAIRIGLGDRPEDPVLTINDLLPHLAHKIQAEKKISEAVPAEKLNVLVGGLPVIGPEETKDAIKLRLLRLLNEKYGLIEEDLVSAELEVVPAGSARNVGIDNAFVGGYGQDDRACAFASAKAVLELSEPDATAIAIFLDKEETGSDGNTGAKSRMLEIILFDLMRHSGLPLEADTIVRVFVASKAISADVTAGVDPDYQEVHEKRNDALMGYGICLTKYTGSRGKYAANDAHAEYVNWIRRVWNKAGVIWQAGELGKVDEGGGGTVAKYLAEEGIDIIDSGPPLLSMHSPFEVAHKADLFMTFKAYLAFFNGGG
jgi:aspartyl aminopeptidase